MVTSGRFFFFFVLGGSSFLSSVPNKLYTLISPVYLFPCYRSIENKCGDFLVLNPFNRFCPLLPFSTPCSFYNFWKYFWGGSVRKGLVIPWGIFSLRSIPSDRKGFAIPWGYCTSFLQILSSTVSQSPYPRLSPRALCVPNGWFNVGGSLINLLIITSDWATLISCDLIRVFPIRLRRN